MVVSVRLVSFRLALLFRRMIAWTSGEAYIPGPHMSPSRTRRKHGGGNSIKNKRHVNDVRFRFHNTQGLGDRRFRQLYLERARMTCEVLGVVETNWSTDDEARAWCSDWSRGSGSFWALGKDPARGVGLFFADSLGDVAAKVLWRDDVEGRALAVQATLHGRTTVIVVFHADVTGGDAAQAASYARLLQHVPVVRDAEYVWMVDANNVTCPSVDGERSDGHAVVQTHPEGVRGLQACLSAWGGLADAYRQMHPRERSFTHRQHIGATEHRSDYYVSRRLDRIYVTRSMTLAGVPFVAAAQHIRPTAPELVALKHTGSKSKWSDHAAVEICVRYTTTPAPKTVWHYPRHRLVRDEKEVKRLRSEVQSMLGTVEDGSADPRTALARWLADTATRVQAEELESRRTHTEQKARLIARLTRVYRMVGDGFGITGSLPAHSGMEAVQQRRKDMEAERDTGKRSWLLSTLLSNACGVTTAGMKILLRGSAAVGSSLMACERRWRSVTSIVR